MRRMGFVKGVWKDIKNKFLLLFYKENDKLEVPMIRKEQK